MTSIPMMYRPTSKESIDADVLFIPTDSQDKDSNRKLNQLRQNPLWQRLEAVKQGKVYLVDYSTWRGANCSPQKE
ncbi:ABC transporter substrate-binding protein [Pleurocapsales cyanobacterium LEGE 06147]|nr:ABC transporter substrate-binding protein [Pleurocapsales cyanobacterium LEGE 06147]